MSIKSTITRSIATNTLRLKRNSPHIFFAGGLIGVATSTVLACKATIKLEKILDDTRFDVEQIKGKTLIADDRRTEKDEKRDLAYAYLKGGTAVGRLYAPAALVGVVSVSALTGSHIQLTRRNTALTIAYTGLHQAFVEYRGRVRDALGEENERDLYFNTSTEVVEDEKGKKQTVKVIDPNGMSVYAKCFDEYNPNWQKSPELNRVFVQHQQNYANQLLQAKGYLFLNDVYESLGLPRTKAGQLVGWFINDGGDNFVDFGMFEAYNAGFMNGDERSVWLDFNVDGVIYDKI